MYDLAEMGLITSEQQGGMTSFYLSGKGYELAKILDHEENGTRYNESYLRVPISGSGLNQGWPHQTEI